MTTDAPIYRIQRDGPMSRVLGRKLVREQWRSTVLGHEWHVGVVDRPIASVLRPGVTQTARWLATPATPSRYAVFGRLKSCRLKLPGELCDYASYRGTITGIDEDERVRRCIIPSALPPEVATRLSRRKALTGRTGKG